MISRMSLSIVVSCTRSVDLVRFIISRVEFLTGNVCRKGESKIGGSVNQFE